MEFPEGLHYTESHEWVREEGGLVVIGITDYAQNQLKDIVFVEFPEKGSAFNKGESFGVVESVKTVADIYSPVTGKVTETNAALKDHPEFVNQDPYGKGWIVKMELQKPEELKTFLSSKDYQGSLSEES